MNTPPPENASESQSLGSFRRIWRGAGALSDWIDGALVKINNLTETNYELAMQHARAGRMDDAIFRFRITLWIAPDHEPSLYNLACLYQHKGEKQKALSLLQRLIKRHPNHTNAIYRVATLDPSLLKPEMRPMTVPPIQVAEYFDAVAPGYDQDRRQAMYRLPAQLHQLFMPELGDDAPRHDLLDIGCGTGLCAMPFADHFTNVIGVDLSSGMLEQAYRRVGRGGVKLYNQLIHQDIRHYLAQPDTQAFDAVLAISVLPYLGDLSLLAEQLGRSVRPGGMVAISFDVYPSQDGFGVLPATGYFGHTLRYVTGLLNAQGFHTVRTGEVEAAAKHFVQLCFFRKAHVDASQG